MIVICIQNIRSIRKIRGRTIDTPYRFHSRSAMPESELSSLLSLICEIPWGLATDLLGEGEEAAEGQGTVRMALAPELGLFTKRCFVRHEEQRCN